MDMMRVAASAALMVGLCGCGSQPVPSTPPTKAEEPSAAKVPASQLGHYASADGFVGLVLDRTGAGPKVRVDKTTEIVELFPEEALERGNKVGHFFNGPDGRAWLFISTDGDLLFFAPEKRRALSAAEAMRVGVRLGRDGDGELLGEATARGVASPPPEKTAFDLATEKLVAISVMKKFPAMKPEDSGNLAKVAELFKTMDAGMLVRVSASGAKNGVWAPASNYIGNTNGSLGGRVTGYPSDRPWAKEEKGLAKWGGQLWDEPMYGRPSRLRTQTLSGWSDAPAAGTPGVIWMTDSTTVVFVALDGGRYQLTLPGAPDRDGMPVEMGGGSPAAWPKPLQHSLINVESVRGFAKGGAIPEQAGKDMEAIDDGFWSCVNKVWDEGRKESEKIETGPGGADAKGGKLSGIPKRYEQKAKKDCEPAQKKLEDALVKFIEARDKERLALFDQAKARATALGLK